MQDENAWHYVVFSQLVKKKLSEYNKEYRIVNDAFIFAIIRFIGGDYAKRMSNDAVENILEIDTYYIQYRTFTYLRVAGMTINPKKIPRYPCNRLILPEIDQQLLSTYDIVRKQHKKT